MEKAHSGSGECILVVEDNPSLRMAVRDALMGEGYNVLTAGDGRKALGLMETSRPDLILSDIQMPGLDGYGFYRAVRARPDWVSIPFIFLTAKGSKEDVLKGKGLGVEDYMTKPFDFEELLVTVRARLERSQAVWRANEAEFERLKQQIVTILSHEMRTPLTYILGFTDMALDTSGSQEGGASREYLTAIKRGGERLAALAEDFLLLVELDAGQLGVEFNLLSSVRADMGFLIDEVARRFRPQAAAHGLSLETAIAPLLPPVRLHETYFVDALGRLLDNAFKFSSSHASRVHLCARLEDGWLEVAVTDEGVGIPPEMQATLFERFRQIGRDKMEQQGVGLGLAIAQGLVRLHGGEIRVQSKLGEGSTFTVRLPAADEEVRT